MKKGMFSGKKTYITATLVLIASVAAFLVGDEVLGQEALDGAPLIELIVMSVLSITLRNGIGDDK